MIVEIECKCKMTLEDSCLLNTQFCKTAEKGYFIVRPKKEANDNE